MPGNNILFPDIAPIIRYYCDGIRREFDFPFPIFASEDIEIAFGNVVQHTGFTIIGAGQSAGGRVEFATPPSAGIALRIERRLPLERLTDFIEGGDFSAQAINTELDFLTAAMQQVSADQAGMLRFDRGEAPANTSLPSRNLRAGKALGFDELGNPIAVDLAGLANGTGALTDTSSAINLSVPGNGAVLRNVPDKLNDYISVRDFGAVGDGVVDDTLAIGQALAAHSHVYIPPGTYIITAPLRITSRQYLRGAGQSSVIRTSNNNFNAIEMTGEFAALSDLRIEGGAAGLYLFGEDGPCVQNAITDVHFIAPGNGIVLDGYTNPSNPCYWNNFNRILIEQPNQNGVYLTRSGISPNIGDTPNANRFHCVRIQSKGTAMAGSGFYVEAGSFNNSFIDCEANIDGSAQACFRLGAGSNKTLLINPYCESFNGVPNILLDEGSIESAIYNLLSASDGAAILDQSGGAYEAYNAGFPIKNRLRATSCSDLTATLLRYDTEFIDTPGLVNVDLSHSQHIVNASNGAIEMRLPAAGDAVGVTITIKKVDNTPNIISITESGTGLGPDQRTLALGGFNDFATLLSNGAQWFIIASNRVSGNTRFFDGSGTYDIDMAVDVYLLSSFAGAMTARLPPADAPEAIGRVITIKKTDVSSNVITVSEQGGAGPDNFAQPLSGRYDAITVVSDGGQWFILSRFDASA